MKDLRISLLKDSPPIDPRVVAAARQVFPTSEIREWETFKEMADDRSGPASQLVVLAQRDDALIAKITGAVDSNGILRWAMVILADASAGSPRNGMPEWNPVSLGQVMRCALREHELLRENQRLRGDLNTVARRIAHDLRTPIGCLQTSSDLLNEMSGDKEGIQKNLAEAFHSSSREITHLVDRVSAVLKASANPVPFSTVEMGNVVRATLHQIEKEIPQWKGKLSQPDAWPEVVGVAAWLQVIWWNFIQNSILHGGADVEIELGWKRETTGFRFSVSDSGPGISATRMGELFAPFEQLHELRIPGLGLSIVHRLVTLQNGQCGYLKNSAGGSCFYFTLPAAH